MFTQAWKKYIAVIIILLKRSAQNEQTLQMNRTDFERAAGGRKIKFNFSQLQFINGRLNSAIQQLPFAKELAFVLLENDTAVTLLQKRSIEFSMTSDFQLSIKDISPVLEPQAEEIVASTEEIASAD